MAVHTHTYTLRIPLKYGTMVVLYVDHIQEGFSELLEVSPLYISALFDGGLGASENAFEINLI